MGRLHGMLLTANRHSLRIFADSPTTAHDEPCAKSTTDRSHATFCYIGWVLFVRTHCVRHSTISLPSSVCAVDCGQLCSRERDSADRHDWYRLWSRR